jgi:hypothetical protein
MINLNAIQIIDEPELRWKPAMQTYEMPPRPWNDASAQSDQDVFDHAYNILLQADEQTIGTALGIGIWNLESLSHDREYGIQLVQPKALENLLVLARTNVGFQIRQCAARVIGSSLWNNPEAMEAIKGSDAVKQLVEILKGEKNTGVRASLIFALSAAAAGEDGMREFMNSQGSQALRETFLDDEPEVQGKCATFIEDNLVWNRAMTGVDEELTKWCQLFQQSLPKESTPVVLEKAEKILGSLMFISLFCILTCRVIKREANQVCHTEPGFIKWLADNVVAENQSEGMMGLLKQARHMFGNPKAARKTAWEDEPLRERDEL